MQGEEPSNGSAPSRSRAAIGMVIGAGVLLILGIVASTVWSARSVPRYQGMSVREWFPLYSSKAFPGESLTNAPPEALPVLMEAFRYQEPYLSQLLHQLVNRLTPASPTPPPAGRVYHNDFEIQFTAIRCIGASCCRPEFAAAFIRAFEALPDGDQQWLLGSLARGERIPEEAVIQLSPWLVRNLQSHRINSAADAGALLLEVPAMARPHAKTLIETAVALHRQLESNAAWKSTICDYLDRLGDLGPINPEWVQPLAAVTDRSLSLVRPTRALTLARLDPSHFNPTEFAIGATNRGEFQVRLQVLHKMLARNAPRIFVRTGTDFGHWLGLFLQMRSPGPETGDAAREMRSDQAAIREVVRYLRRFGVAAPAWGNALLVGLEHPSPVVRRECAETLVKLDVTTPEAVTKAVQYLRRGQDPDQMLLILAAAKQLPAQVEALVRALASDQVPAEWTEQKPLSSEEWARLGYSRSFTPVAVAARRVLARHAERQDP